MRLLTIGAMQQQAVKPYPLQGLWLHFDADKITGLNDGDQVAEWSDLSGNGRDATQDADSTLPIFKKNILNGKPVVRFDGVSNGMVTPSIGNHLNTGDWSVFWVINPGTTGNPTWAGINHSDYWTTGFGINLTRILSAYTGPTYIIAAYTLNSAFQIFKIIHNIGTKTLSFYKNSNKLRDDVTYTGSLVTSADKRIFLMVRGDQAARLWAQADIAEVVIYDRLLSASDNDRVHNYLANKYSI